MKNETYFSSVIFIGLGLFLLLQPYHIPFMENLFSWPTLLLIVGIAFLIQAYAGKEYGTIIPGVVLTGIGVHYHIIAHFDINPNHTGVIILLVALGYLLRYVKTGIGLFQGLIFLAVAIFLLFVHYIKEWTVIQGMDIPFLENIWPIVLIIIGLYYLFKRKRK